MPAADMRSSWGLLIEHSCVYHQRLKELLILMLFATQNGDFGSGSSSWILQGGSMVSASSLGQASAPVKLGQGAYIWQPLWSQVSASLCTCHMVSSITD